MLCNQTPKLSKDIHETLDSGKNIVALVEITDGDMAGINFSLSFCLAEPFFHSA